MHVSGNLNLQFIFSNSIFFCFLQLIVDVQIRCRGLRVVILGSSWALRFRAEWYPSIFGVSTFPVACNTPEKRASISTGHKVLLADIILAMLQAKGTVSVAKLWTWFPCQFSQKKDHTRATNVVQVYKCCLSWLAPNLIINIMYL